MLRSGRLEQLETVLNSQNESSLSSCFWRLTERERPFPLSVVQHVHERHKEVLSFQLVCNAAFNGDIPLLAYLRSQNADLFEHSDYSAVSSAFRNAQIDVLKWLKDVRTIFYGYDTIDSSVDDARHLKLLKYLQTQTAPNIFLSVINTAWLRDALKLEHSQVVSFFISLGVPFVWSHFVQVCTFRSSETLQFVKKLLAERELRTRNISRQQRGFMRLDVARYLKEKGLLS
jgi:hypothetical protein